MSRVRECEEIVTQPTSRGGYTTTYRCGKPTRSLTERCHLHRPKSATKSPSYAPHLAPPAKEEACQAS